MHVGVPQPPPPSTPSGRANGRHWFHRLAGIGVGVHLVQPSPSVRPVRNGGWWTVWVWVLDNHWTALDSQVRALDNCWTRWTVTKAVQSQSSAPKTRWPAVLRNCPAQSSRSAVQRWTTPYAQVKPHFGTGQGRAPPPAWAGMSEDSPARPAVSCGLHWTGRTGRRWRAVRVSRRRRCRPWLLGRPWPWIARPWLGRRSPPCRANRPRPSAGTATTTRPR